MDNQQELLDVKTIKAAVQILQGSVQLRNFGGGQRFQPGCKKIQLVHVGSQHQIIGQGDMPVLRGGIAAHKKVLLVVAGNANALYSRLQHH